MGSVVASIVVLVSFAVLSNPGQIAFWSSWCTPGFLGLMTAIALASFALLGTAAFLCFERAGLLDQWWLTQGLAAGATAAGLLRIDFSGNTSSSQQTVRSATTRAFQRLVAELDKNASVKIRNWASQLSTSSLLFHAGRAPATPSFRQANEGNLNAAAELVKPDRAQQDKSRGKGMLVSYLVEVFVLQHEPLP